MNWVVSVTDCDKREGLNRNNNTDCRLFTVLGNIPGTKYRRTKTLGTVPFPFGNTTLVRNAGNTRTLAWSISDVGLESQSICWKEPNTKTQPYPSTDSYLLVNLSEYYQFAIWEKISGRVSHYCGDGNEL